MAHEQEFVIEKDVPLPESHSSHRGGLSGALRKMEVGDSILLKDKSQHFISAAGQTVAMRENDGRKYMTRTVEGGVRIWRVS